MKWLLSILFIVAFGNQTFANDSCKYLIRAEFVAISSCPSQDIGLFNNSYSSNQKVSYHWNLGDGRTSTLKQPKVSYPTGNQFYTISLDVFDSVSNCRAYSQKSVWIYNKPNNHFSSEIKYMNNQSYRYFKVHKSNPIEHSYTWYLPNHDSVYIVGSNELWLKDTYHLNTCKIGVKVKSNDGCVSAYSKDYRLLSIDHSQKEKVLVINKEVGQISIHNLDNHLSYSILNNLGQIIQSDNITSKQVLIKDLLPGIYHLILMDVEGHFETQQFLVY